MPVGTEVGLGPGVIVLDGDPAPPRNGAGQPPLFGPCLLWPNSRPSQIFIALYHDSSLKRSGMARVNEGSHSFTCHPHVYSQVE